MANEDTMHRPETTPPEVDLPPDGVFGVDGLRDPATLQRMLRELASADLVAEAFGTGEAARFARRCIDERLDTAGALRRLAEEAPRFADLDQLAAVAEELFRKRDAGPIVGRIVTPELLTRLRRR